MPVFGNVILPAEIVAATDRVVSVRVALVSVDALGQPFRCQRHQPVSGHPTGCP